MTQDYRLNGSNEQINIRDLYDLVNSGRLSDLAINTLIQSYIAGGGSLDNSVAALLATATATRNGLDSRYFEVTDVVAESNLPTRLRGEHNDDIPGNDWNNATLTGWYASNNSANAPGGGLGIWHLGMVEAHISGWVTQTVHRFANDSELDGQTYRRHQNSGTWTQWTPLILGLDSGWQTPTLQNGWIAFGGGNASPAYRKIGNRVQLFGLIKNGTATVGTTLFTLPDGYRPLETIHFATVSNALFGYLTVAPNGNVDIQAGSNTWFSISGASFLV